MSIRFECPSCAKKVVVHDRFEGRQVRCPACDIALTVPKRADIEADLREQEELEAARAAEESVEVVPASLVEMPSEHYHANSFGDRKVPAIVSEPARPAKHKRRSIKDEHEEPEEDLEWDITPMVDVAFLLLIFFMLTASFSVQKVIRTAPQQSEEASNKAIEKTPEEPMENLTIQVDEFNAYTVVKSDGGTEEASSRQELITILKELRPQYGEQAPRIVIQAHEDSTHGAVVGSMDAAREADYTKFQMFAVENFD